MKGIHPNLNRGAASFLAATLLVMGCRSTSSGVNNPFLAPDRVSPPSTRVLAPGQAQPYYQGDPLPSMQSGTGSPSSSATSADMAAARSASGRTLAWNAPASGAPPTTAPPSTSTAPPRGVAPQAPAPLARVDEGAVSVPTDTNTLRFALPSPSSAPGAAGLAAGPSGGPQSGQFAAPTNNEGVALASYNAPATNGLVAAGTQPPLSPMPQTAPAWQSPQLGASAPGYAQGAAPTSPAMAQPYMAAGAPAYATAQVPQAMPTNAMAVQLRSVPSPPPQPGDPIPRVRIPGYDVPETAASDSFRARTSMR